MRHNFLFFCFPLKAISLKLRCPLLFILIMLFSTSTVGSSTKPAKVIAGWVEKVTIAKTGTVTKAKLDTGAKTSSIHADKINVYKEAGKWWVEFELVITSVDDKEVRIPMKKPRVRRVKIKDHDGEHDRRVVVNLDICFDGRDYKTEFTLADRTEYIYDVLLGREFLNGVALVDSQQTFETLSGCPVGPNLDAEPQERDAEDDLPSDAPNDSKPAEKAAKKAVKDAELKGEEAKGEGKGSKLKDKKAKDKASKETEVKRNTAQEGVTQEDTIKNTDQ